MKIRLLCWQIILPKEEAAFTYFILESCENLCFYSTISDDKINATIEICFCREFVYDIIELLRALKKQMALTLRRNSP